MSSGEGFDAAEDGAKHAEIIPDARFRLSSMGNRFNEMIKNGDSPVSNRFLERNPLNGTTGVLDGNDGIESILIFFALLARPEHPALRANKFPGSFP